MKAFAAARGYRVKRDDPAFEGGQDLRFKSVPQKKLHASVSCPLRLGNVDITHRRLVSDLKVGATFRHAHLYVNIVFVSLRKVRNCSDLHQLGSCVIWLMGLIRRVCFRYLVTMNPSIKAPSST
jgi:hypothetical protein